MHILYKPRNYGCSIDDLPRTRRTFTDAPSIGWVTLIQEFLNIYQRYFSFQYHKYSGQSKIFQNISFTLLGLPTK